MNKQSKPQVSFLKLQTTIKHLSGVINLEHKNMRHQCFLTAGFALLLVRGNNRVPAPPPSMIAATLLGSACCFSKTGPSNI